MSPLVSKLKLEVPVFNGDPLNWFRFWVPYHFLSSPPKVHCPAQKKMLLVKAMKDLEARRVVETTAGPMMDHEKAVKALKSRYENKRMIFRKALEKLIDPSLSTGMTYTRISTLKQFLEDTTTVMDQCNGYTVEQLVAAIAVQSFEPRLAEKWMDQTTQLEDPPDLGFLLKFLEKQLTSIGSTKESQQQTFSAPAAYRPSSSGKSDK